MSTAIVTDTNSSMTMEEAERYGIYLLPMPIIVNGKEYFEGRDMHYSEFFRLLDEGAEVSTSQPSPDSLMQLWDQALQKYDSLVHIPMSSALSGSMQTAKALAEEFNGRVHVADNRRISITQRRSALDALKLAADGVSAEKIVEILEEKGPVSSIYLAVHTLDLLKKSGRITPSAATIATILGINPVLQIQGGKLDSFAKVRGMKHARKTMLEAISADLKSRFAYQPVTVEIAYSGDEKHALEWQEQVKNRFPEADITLYQLPLSICCHVAGGVEAIGIS
ncbi:MAG: DegV family protein [Oscillospiraceae bacterium]|nr:DegV family protein [Oscillospiraceae bacterium]